MNNTEGTCPHCRTTLSQSSVIVNGRFAHQPGSGLHVNGERLAAVPSVHRFAGVLMRARGRVVSDEHVANALGMEDGDIRAHIAVIACLARKAFEAIGLERPFARSRGKGFAWVGDDREIVMEASRCSICISCGYNLVNESFVESGPFSHDPRTGLAYVSGVPLKGPAQLHSMIGTLMRSEGAIIPFDVIADRMGSDSDNPSRLVRTLVHRLRRTMRHHGADLPIRTIHAIGYQWIGDDPEHRPKYHGPPVPAEIREGQVTGPDLTSRLKAIAHAEHACGCPVQGPGMSAGEWSWSRTTGLRHKTSPFVQGSTPSMVVAHVMAASGRYVHAARHLGHVLGGDPVNAANHLNVLVCKLRAKAAEHGIEVPISAKSGRGIRWHGEPPTLHWADAREDCASCSTRTERIRSLGGESAERVTHPTTLQGRPLLLADLMSAMPGRVVPADRLLELIGSAGGPKIIAVYMVAIRRSYRDAGLPDPVRSHWGAGYEWLEHACRTVEDER